MSGQAKPIIQPSGKQGIPGKEPRLRELLSKRGLTTGEKIVLWKSSELNGSKFPPWTSPPDASDFQCQTGHAPYLDNANFRLSQTQIEIFDCWRRPGEVLDAPDTVQSLNPTMLADEKTDLVQDITSDCSVVASLCAVTARNERGHSNVITCNIYPYDDILQQPTLSPNGKYILRLHFNGCSRKVVIDDRLPVSRTSQTLHVIDRNNAALLWPALAEKAYLKLRGGYDFPGSNSGTDLCVLTGWIPEQLFLQSDDIVRNALWKRIFNAFNYGDVLITIGTGALSQNEEEGLGLAGEHDYAIIDLKEQEGQQLFLVKNPWSRGTVWKGHIYREDTMTNNIKTLADLRIMLETEPLSPGTFWMSLNDVFQNFESMYLNWNPSLFRYREDHHFNWDLKEASSPEGTFISNPQYEIRSGTGGTVWVLLTKHFTSVDNTSDEVSEVTTLKKSPVQGYISLYAYDNDGQRVILNDGPTICGKYVDSPNSLLKLDISPKQAYTVVVSEQALPRSNHSFTLCAYSLAGLSISQAREKYTHCNVQHGAWTLATAGGNASSQSYHCNPQYSIQLESASDIALLLESLSKDFAIHVRLVWAGGKQIHSITTRDIVGDSGEYRERYAFAEIRKGPAGIYTIVCSAVEPGQLGAFTLRIRSMSACVVARVVVDNAGRFVTEARPAEFTPGNDRLLARLTCHRLNRISMTARPYVENSRSERSLQSPLKIGLEYGRGPSKQILAVSGNDEYLDGSAGIRTTDVDIQPEMCQGRGVWVVIERLGSFGPQKSEYVGVELLSDAPIELSDWHIRDGL
ncbi:hypothetical protein N7G274_000370 [Stereocaulon virgatum]|uniref:Calpain catalytic domain-containing protein n=1 Tax=Stereocaulon virgatum TaxID=373712 RepID=A0ABR4AY97_9LECA